MSRSCFSTPPSWCSRSTAPRSSSCADRIGTVLADAHAEQAEDPAHQPPRSPISTGPSRRTTQSIGCATSERHPVGSVDGDRSSAGPRRTRPPARSCRGSRRPRRRRRTRRSRTPVASEEAAMLTALLPSSRAPISRSRVGIRRLTMAARRLPFFSSRSMRARDDAISAVSLPGKKNESSRQRIRTATMRQPVVERSSVERASRRESRATSAASTSRRDESLRRCRAPG